MKKISLAIFLLSLFFGRAHGQGTASLTVIVKDHSGERLEGASVSVAGMDTVLITNHKGQVTITVPANKTLNLIIAYFDESDKLTVPPLEEGSHSTESIRLRGTKDLDPVIKHADPDREVPSLITVDIKKSVRIPTLSISGLIQGVGIGVTTRNALSSAYNVRGGNFDENLVYVNDIQVYRPFLVRSGQQEGLSFINTDMVDHIQFSAGGFQSKYGDKLSSVLDVSYIRPEEFKATVEASLLGGKVTVQDRVNTRFRYMIGARYRTNQYILKGTDVQGNYKPRFIDVQSFMTYNFTSRFYVEWLSSYSENRFLLVPQTQQTTFGTVQNALRLFVAFDGQELMSYHTFMNGVTFGFKSDSFNEIKLISTMYTTSEVERFTVEGGYRLEELENNLGSDNFGQSRLTLGVGYFINHARNRLDATVFSEKLMGRHRGRGANRSTLYEWGIKVQGEQIHDVLREWHYNDSAGHNLSNPGYNYKAVELSNFVSTRINLNSYRMMGYVQSSGVLSQKYNMRYNLGVRSNYWTLNQQNVISPRAQLSFQPNKYFNDSIRDSIFDPTLQDSLLKQDWVIKASAGYYFQPPFYRELRNINGEINRNLKAQQSIHFVLGGDLNFKAWNRPFKFIVEGYYKSFNNLIPYYIDDVRIRYAAVNSSKGYATGIDARVNGQFIRGLESYVNLSLLQTKENITYTDSEGVQRQSGYLRRPTDQRFNASILFQDQLKRDSTFQLQLRLIFGSNLPYYFNGYRRYVESLTIPAYRRVDVGFSKVLFDQATSPKKEKYPYLKSLWISVEIFNMLQFNNTISYLWVKDINNNVYGVPNRLTGRRLNVRLRAMF